MDSIHNILIFFAEKMWVAKATHIFSAKNFSIFAYHSIKINESLINNIVSFEQLGPGWVANHMGLHCLLRPHSLSQYNKYSNLTGSWSVYVAEWFSALDFWSWGPKFKSVCHYILQYSVILLETFFLFFLPFCLNPRRGHRWCTLYTLQETKTKIKLHGFDSSCEPWNGDLSLHFSFMWY